MKVDEGTVAPELFILPPDVFVGLDREDILKTMDAMEELGIGDPPHTEMVIAIHPCSLATVFAPEDLKREEKEENEAFYRKYPNSYLAAKVEFRPDTRMVAFSGGLIDVKTLKLLSDFSPITNYDTATGFSILVKILTVLLATKNAEKKRVKNSSSSASHKHRQASRLFGYTTVIRVGKITESYSSGGVGSPMRPHLRRGHVRHQRIGEGRKETKKIFISPVFVNADKGWIESQRKAYVVKR